MIVWMIRVFDSLWMKSCLRENSIATRGRAGVCYLFTELTGSTHFSPLKRHLDKGGRPSKRISYRRMKHCIACWTEVLMMTVPGGSGNVRCLETWLFTHIVFFVGNTGTAHNWSWRRTHARVLRRMLLVTLQGKRTERSYIWNSFVLVGEVLVTVGNAIARACRLVLLDLGGCNMLPKSANSWVHGSLAGCASMSIQGRKCQTRSTASGMDLRCQDSQLRRMCLMLMVLEKWRIICRVATV